MNMRIDTKIFQPFIIWVLVALLYIAGSFEGLEHAVMDTKFRFLPKRSAADSVVIVDIDSRSLAALSDWPWSRSYHAKVLEQLTSARSRRVIFDIDLSSNADSEGDAALEEELFRSNSPVSMPIFRQKTLDSNGTPQSTVTKPLKRFLNATDLVSINVHPAADGRIRQMPLFETFDNTLIPTVATALAKDLLPRVNIYYIDYGIDPSTVQRVSYVDVYRGSFDTKLLEGADVIIGATALELRDQVPTPLYHTLSGPILHALAYSSIAQDRALTRTAPWLILLLGVFLSLGLTTWLKRYAWRGGFIITAITSTAIITFSAVIQALYPILFDTVPLVFLAIANYGASVLSLMDQQMTVLFRQSRVIRDHDALMMGIVQSSFDAIITTDVEGKIASFNPAAEIMFRCTAEEAMGTALGSLIPRFRATVFQVDQSAADELRYGPQEAVGQRPDGTTFPLEIAITEMVLADDTVYVCSVRDITERQRQTEALRHQALHDDLTDLPNRILLHERITQFIQRGNRDGNRFGLLVMDLDSFKDINDTLGHHLGDQLLQHVAKRLCGTVRATDTLARLGGDEFAFLASDVSSLEEIHMMAKKMVDTLEQPFTVNGLALHVGVSVGCVLFPDHGNDVHTLLQHADVAMYVAKRLDIHYGIYDFAQDHNSVRQLTLRGELRRAIEKEELSLYYQPKISLGRNALEGAEVLVRWHHPAHGFLPPDDFIPMAEQTGLITPLTRWILGTALERCAAWHSDGFAIPISVNLSAKDLIDERLPMTIKELLHIHNAEASWLTLEVTESHIMIDPERASRTLLALDSMGIKITIDDFGTGYSSLGYLKKLPLSELKIDKSFVLDMDTDQSDLAIVRSTVDLAHNLGLTVVAEGVDKPRALELLKELGCDKAQGYLISHPLPPDEFHRWVARAAWKEFVGRTSSKSMLRTTVS